MAQKLDKLCEHQKLRRKLKKADINDCPLMNLLRATPNTIYQTCQHYQAENNKTRNTRILSIEARDVEWSDDVHIYDKYIFCHKCPGVKQKKGKITLPAHLKNVKIICPDCLNDQERCVCKHTGG